MRVFREKAVVCRESPPRPTLRRKEATVEERGFPTGQGPRRWGSTPA